MIKKLLFLLATVGLVANISGCTSKTAQDETEIVENADVDKIDAEATALTEDGTTAPVTDDASLQAALGETTAPVGDVATTSLDGTTPSPTDTSTLDTASLDSVAAAPDISAAPTLDETSLNDIPPPTDASVMALTETPAVTDTAATEVAPLVENPPTETAMVEAPKSTFTSEPSPLSDNNYTSAAKPAGSTLKKVAMTIPYQHGNGWVNTVYVARPGEKLKQISQTIFGSDKSKDLKKIAENSYLKTRSVRAGDKIYYVSPNRPDDSSKTILYYEDTGMVPETYVAQKGDRLKKVAKKLLGSDKSWVELWTSNAVESKDKLAEGETLRYWRSASSINAPVSTTTLAQNTPPADAGAATLVDSTQMPTPPMPDATTTAPDQQLAQNTPPPPDMNTLPPPPPPDAPAPPPPDMNAAGATGMGDQPPPPPPPDMNAPPPPPPADMHAAAPAAEGGKKFAPAEEEAAAIGGLDQDTLMSIGALAVLIVALAFVLISRNKKKRAAEQSMTEHNVGT